jgi:hypothetical protein
LFAPGRIEFVIAKPVVAQVLENFALAARVLKNPVLLVAQVLQADEFPGNLVTLFAKPRLRHKFEAQLGRSHSDFQILGLRCAHLRSLEIDLLEQVSRPRHLLIGRAQPEFLLMLDALAIVKNSLQGELKWHGLNLVEP